MTARLGWVALAVLAALIGGCEPDAEPECRAPGGRCPPVYVAMGDSLTAGYQNHALYASAQRYSYPALIARQLGITGFEQPLIEDPGLPGRLRLERLQPFALAQDPAHVAPLNGDLPRPFHNLGIPGADLADALDDTPLANRSIMHQLVLRDARFGASMLEQALALEPTLLTVWLGANDILAYALSGGTVVSPTAADPDAFDRLYRELAARLADYARRTGAAVVVATIPDVTTIPFVRTLPATIHDAATGAPLLGGDGQPVYYIGTRPGDMVLLTAVDDIRQGSGIPRELGGTGAPLPDDVVLDLGEQAFAAAVVERFNRGIAAAAAAHGFGLADLHAVLRRIVEAGYAQGDLHLNADYVTGGVFSLDGVHPSTWGYVIVANAFIRVINTIDGLAASPVQLASLPSGIEWTTPPSWVGARVKAWRPPIRWTFWPRARERSARPRPRPM